MYGTQALDQHVMHGTLVSMDEFKPQTGYHLADLCDKFAEIQELCAFLLEAYDAIGRESGEMNIKVLTGGTLFAKDLNRKLAELENLLDKFRREAIAKTV